MGKRYRKMAKKANGKIREKGHPRHIMTPLWDFIGLP
jgi:hypothetical protein